MGLIPTALLPEVTMRNLLYLFCLLSVPVYAVDVQPTAKIYEPIVVTHEKGADIQILPWGGEIPKYLDEEFVKRKWDTTTVFSGPPGAYLVVGGGGMRIVIIEGEAPPPVKPDPPVVDPPTDPPVDPPVESPVRQISKQYAVALNDPGTVQLLIDNLTQAIKVARNQSLPLQKETVKAAIAEALRQRPVDKQTKNWADGWRKPVSDAIDASNPTTNYIQLVEQMLDGLRDTQTTRTTKHNGRILFYTRSNCVYCDKWKAEVLPVLQKKWEIVEIGTPDGLVPRFTVFDYGKQASHTGYMSLKDFNALLATLKE